MRILTINAGSNSLKFEIIDAPTPVDDKLAWGTSLVAGSYEDLGKDSAAFQLLANKKRIHQEKMPIRDHEHAATLLFDWLDQGGARANGVASLADIDRMGHRVVHGADLFACAVLVSEAVIEQIAALDELALLHNQPAGRIIKAARQRVGTSLPMFAVFDTAFHRCIPDAAALYALPLDMARRHRIRRYGFHGISHQYLALRFAQLVDRPLETLKVITLHLEGGCSAAAIRHGRSIDTSMGLTPLEGLMMGTRCGDLDPAIVTYLMRREGWSVERTERFLNKDCGLLGVSGRSADTRELVRHSTDPQVDLALDMFCYRVRKYLGAYMAALGGADAIIFGGGIGENTPLVRRRICDGLQWSGMVMDESLNDQVVDREARISVANASAQIWVVPTEEGRMIARLTAGASR